jgi:hypothetical protein
MQKRLKRRRTRADQERPAPERKAVARLPVQRGGSLRRRALSATRGESERVALWLERDIVTALRERAARERMSLSAAVEAALREWLPQP